MRQLSFFPLPASRERTRRPSARPTLTYGATIRLADLRPGQTRTITYATSAHNGARSYYAVYEARLTNHDGQPQIRIGQPIAIYTHDDIIGQPPTTGAEYRQLFSFLARQHSTAARPALEE